MFYCVDSEKALINEDDPQERELIVEMHPWRFWNVFFLLIHARRFRHFRRLFIEHLI